ncbi:hypothetical protein V6N13_049096 [Hibiscus sabdariffa]
MAPSDGMGMGSLNWRKLFAASESQSLQFFPPKISEGEVRIEPLIEVFDEGVRVWHSSLVAQFLSKPPNFNSLVRSVKLLWGKFGDIDINPAGDNLFLIHFPSLENRDWVLANGPWHIQNMPIILRKWQPNLKSLEFNMEKLPIWVHLSRVPLELFTGIGLSYIASALGTPLYMDGITANRLRLSYAKVCVEISVDFKVPKSIPVMLCDGTLASIAVEVPWFPPRCAQCCMFGHVDKVSDRKKEAQKVWVPRKDLQPTVVDKGKSPVLAQKDSSSYASTSAIGFPVVLVQAPDSIVHLSAGTNSLGSVQSGDDLTSGVSINVESVQPDGGIAYVDTRHTHSSSVQTAAISAQLGANPLDSVQYGDDLVSGASINVVSVQPDDDFADSVANQFVVLSESDPKLVREASEGVVELMKDLKQANKNVQRGKRKVHVVPTTQSVTCLIQFGNMHFYVSGVYGHNLGSDRQALWQHLFELKGIIGDKPWKILEKKQVVQNKLRNLLAAEESFLRQKSRVLWVQERDQ